jgi:lysophospholipase L1-like esterase
LASLFVFLLGDYSVGFTYRVLIPHDPPADQLIHEAYAVANEHYHHDLRPRYDGPAAWGPISYRMVTNSLGFRDFTVREVSSDSTMPRLLLIGDSFTEGVGVPYESTVGGQLARHFEGSVEVLNAGVSSYAPAIYRKKVEYLLERTPLSFDAVLLLLDVGDVWDSALAYVIDDGRVATRTDLPPEADFTPSAPAWWRENSIAYRLSIALTYRLTKPYPMAACSFDSQECMSAWTVDRRAMRVYGREGLLRADEQMTALAATLRKRGIPLTIAVYPWPTHILWNDRDSLMVSPWRQWAAREDVGFVQLYQEFFRAVDVAGMDEVISRYFIAGDVHWNANGHAFVAERLAGTLRVRQAEGRRS